MVDWRMVLSVMLALIFASLVEHMVIAPRMANSPANEGIGALPLLPTTLEEAMTLKYGDLITTRR